MSGAETIEVRGLVWVRDGRDEHGDDDRTILRDKAGATAISADGDGRIREISFRSDSERDIGYRSVILDREVFGVHSLRELHWAGILETPMVLELEAEPAADGQPPRPRRDQSGSMRLHGFRRDTDASIAQQLDRHPRAQEVLPDLKGLMQMSVLNSHEREMSGTDAHEVIQWRDGSVTLIEHHAGETGALEDMTLLPPLPDLGGMIQLGQGQQGWFEDQENLISAGMLHLAVMRLVSSQMAFTEERPRNQHLEALLMPSSRLASDFRSAAADLNPPEFQAEA